MPPLPCSNKSACVTLFIQTEQNLCHSNAVKLGQGDWHIAQWRRKTLLWIDIGTLARKLYVTRGEDERNNNSMLPLLLSLQTSAQQFSVSLICGVCLQDERHPILVSASQKGQNADLVFFSCHLRIWSLFACIRACPWFLVKGFNDEECKPLQGFQGFKNIFISKTETMYPLYFWPPVVKNS